MAMASGTLAVVDTVSPSAQIDRTRLYFWMFLLVSLNSLAGLALGVVARFGWTGGALRLFGISAILWVALAAGLALLRNSDERVPPRRLDWAATAIAIAAALVPVASASSVAVTILALCAILTGTPGSPLRRAGIIFLAFSGATLWGRLLVAFGGPPLLEADAFLVGLLAGVEQIGNVVSFADKSGAMAVAAGCSSFQGISLAIVFWATVNQWYGEPTTPRALGWCGAAVAATIALNVLRIGAMAHFPKHLDSIHVGFGGQLFAWATLLLVTAICLYGARHAVFPRD